MCTQQASAYKHTREATLRFWHFWQMNKVPRPVNLIVKFNHQFQNLDKYFAALLNANS